MNIKTGNHSTHKITQQGPKPQSKFSKFVSDNPGRVFLDVADISVGAPLALQADFGSGAGLMKGAGFVLGGIHAFSAINNTAIALSNSEAGYNQAAKRYGMEAAGDALSAVGAFAAVAGSGPVSLGFLLAGSVLSTIAE